MNELDSLRQEAETLKNTIRVSIYQERFLTFFFGHIWMSLSDDDIIIENWGRVTGGFQKSANSHASVRR